MGSTLSYSAGERFQILRIKSFVQKEKNHRPSVFWNTRPRECFFEKGSALLNASVAAVRLTLGRF